ncbi:hypothetical protein [Tritonibacter sp. SIMBA_163]|uniref:hypothetical protein n=1 Tax=Tritonibacter sp. SIMBA_163 TaxID=3080868 RepID=UPI0039803997
MGDLIFMVGSSRGKTNGRAIVAEPLSGSSPTDRNLGEWRAFFKPRCGVACWVCVLTGRSKNSQVRAYCIFAFCNLDLAPMYSEKPDQHDGSPTADFPMRDKPPLWLILLLLVASPPVLTSLLPESILAWFSGPKLLRDIWSLGTGGTIMVLCLRGSRNDLLLRMNAWGIHYGTKKGATCALRWADVVSVAYTPKSVLTGYARLRVRAQVPLGTRNDLTFKIVPLDPKCSNPVDPEVARAQAALDRYWPEWRSQK